MRPFEAKVSIPMDQNDEDLYLGLSPRSALKARLKSKTKKRAGNQYLQEEFDQSELLAFNLRA